jgi:hypothetical protein
MVVECSETILSKNNTKVRSKIFNASFILDRVLRKMSAGSGDGELRSKKTRLVQRSVIDMFYANAEFLSTGPDRDEVCVVVIPENWSCCWNCVLQVPSGPNVLWSSFGANQGKLNPGMKLCWPTWDHPTALVTKQMITYNHSPKNCPTKDMIFVHRELFPLA